MTAPQSPRPAWAIALRQARLDTGWDVHRLAVEMMRAAGSDATATTESLTRRIRAWEAGGSTIRERYRLLLARVLQVDADQLGQWETSTVDLPCQRYATNTQGPDLDGDHPSDAAHTPPSPGRSPAVLPDSHSLQARSNQIRHRLDRTLTQATVTPAQLDLLDERLAWLRHRYIFDPPDSMLELLLAELNEVHTLAAQRQPATAQARLCEITALLATLIADAHMKLGHVRHAHGWYGTARHAADDSTTAELRARVHAQAAMLPYYYGPLASAITLAQHAWMLSHRTPSSTSAFAAATEARARARLGDKAGAVQAINAARDHFEYCDHGPDDDAFAFPERRLLLYLSGAYTHLGHTDRARDVQQRALALYPDHDRGIDPALLRLEEAICLARDRNPTEACQLAETTYLGVPDPHRTPILIARARHVIDVLPPRLRSTRAARSLGEALEIPATTG